ncbi:MAG: hypothetical protein U1C96_07120 [Gallionella sp.]|nr:hypothetical protein [Gallionella sp.]
MRFARADLYMLRRTLAGLAASVIFSALVFYTSDQYAENARRARAEAQLRFDDAQTLLGNARDDKDNLAAYARDYGRLVESGIIGEESRLVWMENMERLRRQNRVADFRYSIAPQTDYPAQGQVGSQRFDIRSSEMKLNFDLLHEAQLVDFFSALREQSEGWYQLEHCTVQRGGAAPPVNLRAECAGGWITLRHRRAAS